MASLGRIAVLIDLSGTLHVEDICIAGAPAALQRLRRNPRYAIKFVTNTTKVIFYFLIIYHEILVTLSVVVIFKVIIEICYIEC